MTRTVFTSVFRQHRSTLVAEAGVGDTALTGGTVAPTPSDRETMHRRSGRGAY